MKSGVYYLVPKDCHNEVVNLFKLESIHNFNRLYIYCNFKYGKNYNYLNVDLVFYNDKKLMTIINKDINFEMLQPYLSHLKTNIRY